MHNPVIALTACTRNISCGGLGLLIKRVILRGQPVEILIQPPETPPIHFGGTVAICRYAGRGFHELGVRLHTSSTGPLFSVNRHAAIDAYPW